MICTVYRSQIIWLWAILNQIWLLFRQKGMIIMLSQKEHINSIVLEFEMHISAQKYISKLLRIQICFCRTNYQTIFRLLKYWSCQDGLNTETRENTSISTLYVLVHSALYQAVSTVSWKNVNFRVVFPYTEKTIGSALKSLALVYFSGLEGSTKVHKKQNLLL